MEKRSTRELDGYSVVAQGDVEAVFLTSSFRALPVTPHCLPGFIPVMVASEYVFRDVIKMGEAEELQGCRSKGKSLGLSEARLTLQTDLSRLLSGRAF